MMKKFKKSEIQNLFNVKGGSSFGSKTVTQSGTTVEFKNDSDPTAAHEAQASLSPVEP